MRGHGQAETYIRQTTEDLNKHRADVESHRQESDRLRCAPSRPPPPPARRVRWDVGSQPPFDMLILVVRLSRPRPPPRPSPA